MKRLEPYDPRGWKLTRNAVKCLTCDTVVESKHRHDFKWCSCGAIAVDGGLDYARRVGKAISETSHKYEDLCEWKRE